MEITHLFKLLSDETRLRIMLLLHQDALCVCELCGILDAPQPKVSKILAKLRDLDLVTDTRKDKFIYYTLKKENTLLMRTLEFTMTATKENKLIINDQKRLLMKDMLRTSIQKPSSNTHE